MDPTPKAPRETDNDQVNNNLVVASSENEPGFADEKIMTYSDVQRTRI